MIAYLNLTILIPNLLKVTEKREIILHHRVADLPHPIRIVENQANGLKLMKVQQNLINLTQKSTIYNIIK